jgi:LysR family transcriptional activator of glutamate synthase operon
LWNRSRYISRAALEFREVVEAYFGALSKETIETET